MEQEKTTSSNGNAVSILRNTPILQGVSATTIAKIAAIADPLAVDEGEILYSLGDPARSAYIVISGRLRFTLGGDGRPEASGSIIPPGDILGWAALLVDQPRRIATVMALEPCRLLAIEGKALLQLLDDEPRAGFLVMQRLAKMITQSFLEQSTRLNAS
ncbi:MAG TPA: cyclic nucleotide-binding domain-containing protein [Stellaceae bacterium]|jgi:CRP-like cAMP-binding protein|nr:cyclic nucleotide-binding domain-containing protein [Stellaceae bacterium]